MHTVRNIARSVALPAALLLALFGETAALYALAVDLAWTALGWHVVAALSCALAGSRLTQGVAGSRPRAAAAVAGAFALSLPGVGFMGLLWVVLPHWGRARREAARALLELELPAFHERDRFAFDPGVAAQPIEQQLAPERPVEQRVRSVMALRRMDPRRAVPLLRLALGDTSEDVRLLAYAILERREKQIRGRIERALRELRAEHAPSPNEALSLLRGLASDHWELVYGGFSEGEGRVANLAQAAEYAEAALHTAFDGATALLLARVRLQQSDGVAAWRLVVAAAERGGIASDVCAPLLAEAAFLQRKFDWIPRLLSQVADDPSQAPGLQPVASFWNTGMSR